MPLPDKLEIQPLEKPPDATIAVPGSKSITNRALVLAALASKSGPCQLAGILHSEDTEVMVQCLQQLGFQVQADWQNQTIIINKNSSSSVIPAESADLYVANSGTTMRFLTALVGLGQGQYRLDGNPRMRERPIGDLLDALNQLGVEADYELEQGFPPIVITANGLAGGSTSIVGNISSQFLSGLLMVAPLAQKTVHITVEGPLVSVPYVEMTIRMMQQFGATLEQKPSSEQLEYIIPGKQHYFCEHYQVEPDASAASYFFAAAAITGGKVSVIGIPRDSLQGDIRFVDLLERMGCTVSYQADVVTVQGGPLAGIDVDMNDISDTVMTLAAVACFANGPTTIRNVAHIRHKETDRLTALRTELERIGVQVEEWEDGLRIHPQSLSSAEIETYNDHRMAMSMALVGLKVRGIVIKQPACVQKTYPNFFEDVKQLY